jgi:hypothetical protein
MKARENERDKEKRREKQREKEKDALNTYRECRNEHV